MTIDSAWSRVRRDLPAQLRRVAESLTAGVRSEISESTAEALELGSGLAEIADGIGAALLMVAGERAPRHLSMTARRVFAEVGE